jgi:uncharacterized membrane protein YqjE
MPTRESEAHAPKVGDAAKSVAEHASAIARLELELAGLEVKRKIAALGIGIGLGVGAALFMLFMLGFAFATVAAGLATAMATWVALLITTVILLAIGGLLGVLAIGAIKRGTPPVPTQAIEEAKLTSAALKSNGNR